MLPLFLAAALAALPAGQPFRPSVGPGLSGASHIPSGYVLQVVARRLTFPVDVAFDDAGEPLILESGGGAPSGVAASGGPGAAVARVLRVTPGGRIDTVVEGGLRVPLQAIAFGDGSVFLADATGVVRITPDGARSLVEDGLVARGLTFGSDGYLYLDAAARCSPPAPPAAVDRKPAAAAGAQARSCGAVMRVSPSGGKPHSIAGGLRGLVASGFGPDGRLYVLAARGLWPLDAPEGAVALPASTEPGRFDFARPGGLTRAGTAFVPEEATGSVVLVNPAGVARPFLSLPGTHPVAVRVDPYDGSLYVVDLGRFEGGRPLAGSGRLLRLTPAVQALGPPSVGPQAGAAPAAPVRRPAAAQHGAVPGVGVPARRLAAWASAVFGVRVSPAAVATAAGGLLGAGFLVLLGWCLADRRSRRRAGFGPPHG